MNKQTKNKNMKRCAVVFCTMTMGAVLLLGGCGNDTAQNNGSTQPANNQNQTAVNHHNQHHDGNNNDIGLDEAKKAALAHAGLKSGDVSFVKGELDYDNGVSEYDLEFVTGDTKYEYEVKASDGTIMKNSQEPIEHISNNGGAGLISVDEAKATALKHAGFKANQVAYTSVTQEYDDGRDVYEIEFYVDNIEYSYTIDAANGKILESEKDRF